MKLELKHIASHLPYNLQFKIFGQIRLYNWGANVENVMSLIDYGKPILHPLSDLIKEIEINGEWFVPIEKLFDIETECNWSCSDYTVLNSNQNEYWVSIKDVPSNAFGYNANENYFYYTSNECPRIVTKQLELFQKLYEWHFDVDNLIENELAIDINTL